MVGGVEANHQRGEAGEAQVLTGGREAGGLGVAEPGVVW